MWVQGDKIIDKEVIKKILHSMPEHLQQVVISIETLLDLNSMSIEVATGHLRAVEQRKKKLSGGAKDGQLLLNKEEWMARLKVREGESGGGGGHGRGHDRENETVIVGAATMVAAGDRKVTPMKKVHVRRNQTMCAGPLVNLVTGPRNAGPREKTRWARPIWLKRRKVGLCWWKPTPAQPNSKNFPLRQPQCHHR